MPANSSIPFNIKLAERLLIPEKLRPSNSTQNPQTAQTATDNFNNLFSQQQSNITQDQINTFKQLPFWILDTTEHRNRYDTTLGKCCFNHYVGLPWKVAKRSTLFDYEIHQTVKGQPGLFNAYENNDCVWILKATGLGITEFSLRYMCWKAMTGDKGQYENSEMVIVVGPNVPLAYKLINRIRFMFYDRLGIIFESNRAKITLPINNVTIEAYPSNHVDSFRSLEKVSFILIDEGDFFHPGEQQAVRDAAERYRGKSNAKIVIISTPGEPGGLMERIEQEENSMYLKLKLNYEVGLNKIFTQKQIQEAKRSPSFEREYNLKYAYDVGDLFTLAEIQRCFDFKYDPDNIVQAARTTVSMDPGFGSSKFAILVSQLVDNRIQILYAEEFDKPEPHFIEQHSLGVIRKYLMLPDGRSKGQILVDGANPAYIRYLKRMLNENVNYEEIDRKDYKYMLVRPVLFNAYGKEMLTSMKQLVSKGYVAIDEKKFTKLINQMRMARTGPNYDLIKKPLTLDLIDALRLNMMGYQIL